MSWLITPRQPAPAVIGEPFGGGFFAGYISHTADGNPTHALIVAPRATGFSILRYRTGVGGNMVSVQSSFDGVANMNAIVALGISAYPAAEFCRNLRIGGFADWYLPSRYELEIAYSNLKPTTHANSTASGQNPYSVPPRSSNYQSSNPAQTSSSLFSSGTEAYDASHIGVSSAYWSSTNISSTLAFHQFFDTGSVEAGAFAAGFVYISENLRVRAFRRIAL